MGQIDYTCCTLGETIKEAAHLLPTTCCVNCGGALSNIATLY